MRVLVTGSREWTDEHRVWNELDALVEIYGAFVVVQGECPTGADRFARSWAWTRAYKCESWPADWDKHGKAAGPIRNQLMVNSKPDFALAFPLPGSRGTMDCMRRLRAAGVQVKVVTK